MAPSLCQVQENCSGPGVAEHPIPGGNVQAGKRLQPGGQPHADGIDHELIVEVALGMLAHQSKVDERVPQRFLRRTCHSVTAWART